ncbi:baseplate J/gp47 family protein [Metaclostridioides mangenotii]|uniref:Phage protein gp47/JayE n=1 Tax=Metaclostridioides mangenotii TaxID=1540 RepID=A0ABS4E909_9FIRM|nr:baseplate J/gp47 family protein [Clostridioides mangenotii]MBP1854431.1 putative phage protein gp47/JayE [Clostridioides mangenotii]
MYSKQTYEVIKNRALSNIDLDLYKGEGSFLNNMIAGTSTELAKMYIELSNIHKMAFIQETYDTFLDARVNEFGIYRKMGTEATGEVEFIGKEGREISNGTIISYNDLMYIVIKDVVIGSEEGNTSPVQALEIGVEYNIPSGTEFELMDEIRDIERITNLKDFTGGTEIEDDDELRDRFYRLQRDPATSGNIAHYEQWALEVEGVYNVKVYPRWDGPGNIKVMVLGNDNVAVDEEIVQRVKDHIEEEMPIGVTLTVVTPTNLDVVITVSIEVESGYTLESVKILFLENISTYLRNVREEIIYTKVSAILGLTDGIKDFIDLTINGSTENILVSEDKIPSVKEIDIREVV